MFRSLRNALVAGLIAAAGMMGISYATTGSLNPVKVVDPGPLSTTGPSGPSGTSGPSGPSGPTGPSGPSGPKPTHGPERSTEGCPAGFTGNHGQFVSSQPKGDRSDAAQSDCGKPVSATQHNDKETPEPTESPDADHNDHGDANQGDQGQHGQQGQQGQHGDSGDHGHGHS